MATIKETLSETLKTAMKSGDKDKTQWSRTLHAAIRKKEIDEKIDLDDAAVMKIIQSLVKQRQDSIEQFRAGNREDLASKEETELKFLQTFLPKQLDESELKAIVEATVVEVGATSPKDMGKVMAALQSKVAGRADGKMLSGLVKAKLG